MGPDVDMTKLTTERRITTERFIEEARKVHGDLYDYSNTRYLSGVEPVAITCKVHGVFYQQPFYHLRDNGLCPKCIDGYLAQNKPKDINKFIEKSKGKFGDYFNYDNAEFVGDQFVKLTCPKHGDIVIGIESHLRSKTGCRECSFDLRRKSQDDAIKRLREVHGDKYDYSQVEFKNIRTRMKIICPKHGAFYQTYKKHSSGIGCPECGKYVRVSNTDEFKMKMLDKYGDRYDLSNVDYYNNKTKVKITCNRCGRNFEMRPNDLLTGHGCPCFETGISDAETEIYTYIKSIWPSAEHSQRVLYDENTRGPKEIDVYIPELKIGFEYNGLYWHSNLMKDSGHLVEKQLLGKRHGITIYHIFEDEWIHNRKAVENRIDLILKRGSRLLSSSCYIKEIPISKNEEVIRENAIGKWDAYEHAIGYYYRMQLISILTYRESEDTVYVNEIIHTSSTSIVNELRNMLSYIQETHPDKTVKYSIDNRWNDSAQVEDAWLVYDSTTGNTAYGVYSTERVKDPTSSKMVIYDCGKTIFIYKGLC